MIENLIHLLGTQLDFNAEEVSDLLWLILEQQKRTQSVGVNKQQETPKRPITVDEKPYISPSTPPIPEPATPPKIEQVPIYAPSVSQSSSTVATGYTPLAVPDARALNQPLDLLKALKPLFVRVPSQTETIINETATAEWIAQTQLWQIITEPDLEQWLELVLVVDESLSMMLWRRTVTELQQFFRHYGLFRDVKVWGLGLDENNKLYFGSPLRPHQPKELIDLEGRRLILIVSDFVDSIWHQEEMLTVLEQWTEYNPVAALQMLPEWLWSRSAFALHTPAILQNINANIINANLNPLVNRLQKRRGLDKGINLPVFSLEPEQTQRWSQMLAGGGEKGAIGYVLRHDLLRYSITKTNHLTATERVANFRANASPLALKLAGLLASAPVITMPVVRLIQSSMLKESSQIQVAEVFLGGLLKVQDLTQIPPETDPELVNYEFMEGVRVELGKIVSVPARDEVLDLVSRYVAKGLGRSLREFIAWIRDPSSAECSPETVDDVIKPFAQLTREILGQLVPESPPEKRTTWDDLSDFDFQPLEVNVKTLEREGSDSTAQNSIGLKTLKFETVFVNQRGEIIETKPCQAYYYLEPLQKLEVFEKSTLPTPNPSQEGKSEVQTIEPLTMIYIPKGEFIMGSHDNEEGRWSAESPQHRVEIAPFYMSQTPITQAQWQAIASFPQVEKNLELPGLLSPNDGDDDHPIRYISWHDAIEFCARLSIYTGRQYRLPSEAEWEYACRGFQSPPVSLSDGEDKGVNKTINRKVYPPFHCGDSIHFGDIITDKLADDVYYTTDAVRSSPPNAFGLYDMHGNVWQWCLDPWYGDYKDAPSDGRVWDKENQQKDYYDHIVKNIKQLLTDKRDHVLRGGSYDSRLRYCRSAYRIYDLPLNSLGFRVVCVLPN